MIVIKYDPVLGCVGWDFPRPERVPLKKEEVAVMVKAWVNVNRITKFNREPLDDIKGKKQRHLEFQKQANE